MGAHNLEVLECVAEGALIVGTLVLWTWAITVLSNLMGG